MSFIGNNPKVKTINYQPLSADPTNPFEGMVQYADGTVRSEGLYVYTNGTWTPVGSESSGIIDFLGNGNFEDATVTGWATYADAAAAIPVDMTGGSATITFAASSSSPLNGSYSALLTKDAANRQGEGAAKTITIPAGYDTRMLTLKGIYETSAGVADDDVVFYAYDITNSALVEPVPFQLKANEAGTFNYSFQVPSGCTSMRVGFHIASTSATAYTVKLDDMTISVNSASRGPVMTDPIAYTPTYAGFGTVGTSRLYWQRKGSTMSIFGRVVTGTPNATTASFTLPFGLNVGQVGSTDSNSAYRGVWVNASVTGVNARKQGAFILTPNSNTIQFGSLEYALAGGGFTALAGNSVSGTSDSMTFELHNIPIVGWSSNQVVSEDSGARQVAFSAYRTASGTSGNGTDAELIVNNKDIDTTGSFDIATGRFTAPESGYYTASFETTAKMGATPPSSYARMYILKNGTNSLLTILASWNQDTPTANASYSVVLHNSSFYLNKGDYISIWGIGNNQSFTYALPGGGSRFLFTGSKLSGNQQISASEKVFCSYSSNSGQAVTSGNTIVYEDKISDSHNAYNSSTGVWKAPRAGRVNITASVYTESVAASVQQILELNLTKNGTIVQSGTRDVAFSTTLRRYVSVLSSQVDVIKGDELEIVFLETLPAVGLSVTSYHNVLNISMD